MVVIINVIVSEKNPIKSGAASKNPDLHQTINLRPIATILPPPQIPRTLLLLANNIHFELLNQNLHLAVQFICLDACLNLLSYRVLNKSSCCVIV